MNRMIAQMICVTNEKLTAFQRQIWQTFVTRLWCCKTKITDGTGIWFMWESCEIWFLEVTANFGIVPSKNALQSNYNYNPIEITWRKTVCSVCLKPVSMATWRWHTLWRFTLPANSLNWAEKEFEFFLLYPRDRHLCIICMTIACARFASTFVSKITYALSFA